jgi:hypothetical protein
MEAQLRSIPPFNQTKRMKIFINVTQVSRDGGERIEEFAELAANPVPPTTKTVGESLVSSYAIPWYSSACSPAGVRRAIKARIKELRIAFRNSSKVDSALEAML